MCFSSLALFPAARRGLTALAVALFLPLAAHAQGQGDALLDAAQQALQQRREPALQALAEQARAQQHPLAPWVDYWALGLRLTQASAADVEAFYARWRGQYVEDRLRNDWLLVLGQRGDWDALAADYPRFRMDDDANVRCHALHAEQRLGRGALKPASAPLKARALAAWLADRDGSSACTAMASALWEAGVLGAPELWAELRSATEAGRARAFRHAAGLLPRGRAQALQAAYEDPVRFLQRRARASGRAQQEEAAIALVRLGATDTARAAALYAQRQGIRWAQALAPDLRAWVLSQLGRFSAQRLEDEAAAHYAAALAAQPTDPLWSEDTWAWGVRAALRAQQGAGDWPLAARLLDAMPEAQRRADPAWPYWQAQARYRSAAEGTSGDAQRAQARAALQAQADPLHFYGQLAAEDLGLRLPLPEPPLPPTEAERAALAQHPGLTRALRLIQLGLRSEGVREWNFTLRDIAPQGERALLAAAERACVAEVWDRCINTSERTRQSVDLAQRYPTPFRAQVLAQAQAAGLSPADPFGLIRQESRFILDARSGPGAAGLMQVMPATAKWTARKIGLTDYHPSQIKDPDVNLRLGMAYLRHVLDAFDRALPLAAAAYNAGPGRPARWREGVTLDAAAWAETIPFNETRDYVKKVLAGATVYARLLGHSDTQLRQRLGQRIGPRVTGSPNPAETLP